MMVINYHKALSAVPYADIAAPDTGGLFSGMAVGIEYACPSRSVRRVRSAKMDQPYNVGQNVTFPFTSMCPSIHPPFSMSFPLTPTVWYRVSLHYWKIM